MNVKALVITAVEAEKEAVQRGLGHDQRFDVIAAGVGPIAAAVRTMAALSASPYDLVISAGIGGGFVNIAPVGSVVIASKVIVADLGSQTAEGFRSMDELGFGTTSLQVDERVSSTLAAALRRNGITVCSGPILTVSTTTGTAVTASDLAKRVPGAAAEAMEGFGVAAAAHYHSLPFIEIRTISNAIGPRDRAAWKIKEALTLLEQISVYLPEVIV
jgi:futalosine hydrolase